MGTGGHPMSIETDFRMGDNTVVSLLSTGLDSPVATYLMLKKGYNAYTLSFLNGETSGYKNQEKIVLLGKKLIELTGQHLKMHFVDYDKYLDQFITHCERKITCLLCKRTMIRMAVTLAQRYHAKFIINGDILGEQASQTLDNLYVVNEINRTIPIIRPLIGFDKSDVIKINQELGFYEISLIKGVGCVKNPKYPETHAKLGMVRENENNIDYSSMIQAMLKEITIIDL
jgi:tRNA uracil 4-sulfurtransferase